MFQKFIYFNGHYFIRISCNTFDLFHKLFISLLFAALSKHDPEITGLSQSYAYGDYIDANCTSDQSNLDEVLTWYIDERKVSE